MEPEKKELQRARGRTLVDRERDREVARRKRVGIAEMDALLGTGYDPASEVVPDVERAVQVASAHSVRELARVVLRASPATPAQRQAAAQTLIGYAERQSARPSRSVKYLSESEITVLVARSGDLRARRPVLAASKSKSARVLE